VQDQIDFIVADLDNFTRGEVIALALNINANLRSNPPLGTPIDTGWASANWVPSIGEPFDDPGVGEIRDPTPGQVAGRAQTAESGLNDVLSWRNGDGPIFSTNNVPYIGRLNEGHSAQSPAGFVQAAIEKGIQQTYSRAGAQGARNRRAATFVASKPRPRR
jgi:hypothetical protein